MAFDIMPACYLAVLGMTVNEEANEKPEPSKSKNIKFANWVALFALSVKVLSRFRLLGPIPATFIYWADLPGVPAAMISRLLLRLSGLVYPSMP